MVVPDPPDPFDPAVSELDAGHALYRVHTHTRSATEFNPGTGGPTRFAFFGSPVVPVLYAAERETAAVAETLLHDVPVAGGLLAYDSYARAVMSRLVLTRPLRLAALHGLGLRRLGVSAEQLTASPPATYPQTVAWAAAAHREGFDGLVWMSRLCNDARAFVLFGDRAVKALTVDETFARVFAAGRDLAWLVDVCAPLRVDVLPPGSPTAG